MSLALLTSASSAIGLGANLQVIPKKIECKRSDLQPLVLPLLRGRVFHVTEETAFADISRSGWIDSKQLPRFVLPFGKSENSYGLKRGWVSLFDLSNTANAYTKDALIHYYLRKAFHNKSTAICFLFIAENAWPSLISWQHARQEVERKEMYIPFVEAWYPGDIPLHLVNDSLVLTVKSRR
jgi:hypothetical protein